MADIVKIGDTIKGYEIIEQIGNGGNSFVYKVVKNNKYYAMKVMKRPLYNDNLKRYNDEVKFQKDTNHENIVKVYDSGSILVKAPSTRVQFYVMDLYSFNFRYLLDNNTNKSELIKLFLDICQALSYCHKRNVLHRDLKLENLPLI